MALRAQKLYTPEEYLSLEERSAIRHEYINGEIYAIAGGTTNHNRLVFNTAKAIDVALTDRKQPRSVFLNDVRVQIKKSNIYTYPDVIVICGKIEYDGARRDIVLHPILIVEVLSEATEKYDRTDKFAAYRRIPSLQVCVMIDQARVYVEVFRRTKSKLWTLEAYSDSDETLNLASLDIAIPLSAVYDRVEWEAP